MSQDIAPESVVTILIPHFQTEMPIRLCLRSLRKYTNRKIVVRVLDNGSKDESLDYLRSVSWIELVERNRGNDTWKSHYEALNEALPGVTTPLFLIMHSDTFVHSSGWLDALAGKMLGDGFSAAGSRHQRIPVRSPGWLLLSLFRAAMKPREHTPGVPVLRSLCALYRRDHFAGVGGRFVTEHGEDINYEANARLVKAGRRILAMSASELSRHIFHASAVTLIENDAEILDIRRNAKPVETGQSYLTKRIYERSLRAYHRFMVLDSTIAILNDDSLDR